MKFTHMRWAFLSIGVLLLAACSSGRSTPPPNTVVISTTDAAGVQRSLVANSGNSIISAHTDTVSSETVIQICSDIDKDNDCSKVIVLTIDGTTPGKRPMDSIDSPTQIMYHDDDLENGVIRHYVSNSGEIGVTAIGSAGSAIQGYFNAVLECSDGCADTVTASGSFNIPITQ